MGGITFAPEAGTQRLRDAINKNVTEENLMNAVKIAFGAGKSGVKLYFMIGLPTEELSDLDGNAYSTVSDVEHDFTRFLKLTAMPPAAMGEDLICQSNAWLDVEAFNGRSWQHDALDYTRAFRAKFPAWAQAYEQQAQADTNKPPFTAEDQAKISALATELEKLQIECCEKILPPKQEKALELIGQIQKLLPKDKNGGGQGQGRPPPQNDKNDNKDKQDQNRKDGQDQQQDQQQDQRQNEEQDKEEDKKDESAGEDEKKDGKDQELEAVLKKAQERNDEHEAEKKARMRKAPLPPNERDW
jgi:hypothetical protein